MTKKPKNIRFSLFGVLSVLLSATLFSLLYDHYAPKLVEEPIRVLLTPNHPDSVFEIPEDALQPQNEFKGPAVKFGGVEHLAYAIEVPEAGRYSLYGTSSNHITIPVTIRVNGNIVTRMAFYQDTGSLRRHFEKHGLATGVKLDAGRNSLDLQGPLLKRRTLYVELYREYPLTISRYLLLTLGAVVILISLALALRGLGLKPRAEAIALILLVALMLVSGTAALYWKYGRDLINLGDLQRMGERIDKFETYLRSPERTEKRDELFSVAVFGDSTHWYRIQEYMRDAIRDGLPVDQQDQFEIYGLSYPGFTVWEYYLLLNRFVDERPDLLVIPVNLHTFAPIFLKDRELWHMAFDGFTRFSEYPAALGVSVQGRKLRFSSMLLQKLDRAFFNGKLTPFFHGLKRYHENVEEAISENVLMKFGVAPEGARAILKGPAERDTWDVHIEEDHGFFQLFECISRLAMKHGIEVLYYTVPVNEQVQAEQGFDMRLQENYALIGDQIRGEPGVHYLDLSANNPPELFFDEFEHLTVDGIKVVGGNIADAIVSIRNAKAPTPQSQYSIAPLHKMANK